MPKRSKKPSLFSHRYLVPFVVVGVLALWFFAFRTSLKSLFFAPSTVAEIKTKTPLIRTTPKSTPTPPLSPGCYYQEVQCIKDPCNPVVICSSPTPKPSLTPGCYETEICYAQTPEGTGGGCRKVMNCPEPTSTPIVLPSRIPALTPKPICDGTLTKIDFNNRCGISGFSQVRYQCSTGESLLLDNDTCYEVMAAYSKAAPTCKRSCL